MVRWSKKWLLGLNSRKCHVMHVGRNNQERDYWLGPNQTGVRLATVDSERDLGVVVSKNLKWAEQCSRNAAKVNMILRLLKRSISSRNVRL